MSAREDIGDEEFLHYVRLHRDETHVLDDYEELGVAIALNPLRIVLTDENAEAVRRRLNQVQENVRVHVADMGAVEMTGVWFDEEDEESSTHE